MRTTSAAILSIFAMMGMLSPGMAQAAEIIILAGQGVVSAVRDVAPAFERASGHKVVVSFEVGPGLMNKVNSDAPVDVVTHYPDMIDDLTKKGKVLAGTGVVSRWHRCCSAGGSTDSRHQLYRCIQAFNARC